MSDTDSGEVESSSLRTVGGSWQGSPKSTKERQLSLETKGTNVAGSTL